MIDFGKILGFQWDNGNLSKSMEKHGVTPRAAERVFLDRRLLVLRDETHSGAEPRFHAYGESPQGRKLLVSFTLRDNDTLIRIISARAMSRKERQRYAQDI